MAKQNINVGTKANDKAGDPLRTAFTKINDNFTELYTLTGGTSTALTELAQDYAAPLFNHASHTNITATYDDANNKILLTGVAAQVQSNWTASSGLGVILNKPTLFSGSYTDLTNKPTIPTSFSSLVNGANTVSLGSGGALTIPGAIRSEGNINIDINLADSTLRRWQFGEDGELTFPGGYLKIVPNGANPYISNRTDNGLGLVSGSAIQIRQSTADAYGITIDSSTTDTSLGGGASLAFGSAIDVSGGKIILGQYTSNYVDANNGLTGQNKIEINDDAILIGLKVSTFTSGNTTSTFSGWTFEPNTLNGPKLTFPDATVQTTAYIAPTTGNNVIDSINPLTISRNGMTIRVTSAGMIQMSFNSVISITGRSSINNADSTVISSPSGATVISTWYNIGAVLAAGDHLTATIVDASFHKIYRLTAIIRQKDTTPGSEFATAYAIIEQLQ